MAGGFSVGAAGVAVSSFTFIHMAEGLREVLASTGPEIWAQCFDPYIDGYLDQAFFVDLTPEQMRTLRDAVKVAAASDREAGAAVTQAWSDLLGAIQSDDRLNPGG